MEKSSGFVREVVVLSKYDEAMLFPHFVNRVVRTPQREYVIEYTIRDPSLLPYFRRHHTIVYMGVLGDTLLDVLTTPAQRKRIEERGYLITRLKDPWVEDQVLYVVGVKSVDDFRPAILRNREMLYRELRNRIFKRVGRIVYELGRERGIESMVEKRLGIEVAIPSGFKVIRDDSLFISMVKYEPVRFLFFAKVGGCDISPVRLRDSLTAKYYEGDYVYQEYLTVDTVEFDGMECIRMQGVWQNDRLTAGGPFVTYIVRWGDSCYVLDGGVFAPEKRKLPYLIQVESILRNTKIKRR